MILILYFAILAAGFGVMYFIAERKEFPPSIRLTPPIIVMSGVIIQLVLLHNFGGSPSAFGNGSHPAVTATFWVVTAALALFARRILPLRESHGQRIWLIASLWTLAAWIFWSAWAAGLRLSDLTARLS
jgi:hypothetical protein